MPVPVPVPVPALATRPRRGHRGGRAGLAAGLALALAALAPWGARLAVDAPIAAADESPRRLEELNRTVLEVAARYPTDGTHRYNWPRGKAAEGYDGVTEDLTYLGTVIARANAQREAYCCGLTFEVWFKAWEAHAARRRTALQIAGLDVAALRRLRSAWYCAGSGDAARQGPVAALVPVGLGVRIERLEDARPGDFVQLWRKSGSGHSVIFLAWVRDRRGAIEGIEYWSTQPSTNGIGRRVERFDGAQAVLRDELYIARAGVPR